MSKKTLSYRPLEETDVDSLVSLWGDYEVIKYTGIKKVLMTAEILERIRFLSDYDMFAVLNGKELIGVVGCLSTDDNRSFSLSYHFKKAVWGYGFATQSVEWMLSHISQQYGAVTFTAELLTVNIASVKILERAGFHAVGERTELRDGNTYIIREYMKGGQECICGCS